MHTSCVLLSHVPPPFCRMSCVHRHRCYCCQHLHKRKHINTAAVRNLNGAHRCTEWIENTRGQIQPFVVLTHSWHSKGQKCIQPLPTISITDQIMTSAHECAPCIAKFQLSTFSFSAAHCAEQDSETKLCRSHFGHLCSHLWNAQDHWNPGKANHCTDKKMYENSWRVAREGCCACVPPVVTATYGRSLKRTTGIGGTSTTSSNHPTLWRHQKTKKIYEKNIS